MTQEIIIQDGFVTIGFKDGTSFQCHTEYLKKALLIGFSETTGTRKFTVVDSRSLENRLKN
jgi:hypothetical protein